MVVGAIGGRTQLAIIGAGPGGYVAALRAADAGLEVTLIDGGPVGGTCLHVGCIPSKALIEVADLHHRANHATDHGLRGELTVDMETLRTHLTRTTGRLHNGVQGLLSNAGVKVVAGIAHFARYDRLSIEHGGHVDHLEFDNAIVATGSRPIALTNFPLSDRVLDSTGALALTSLPKSIAIIGGGYIGLELGTAFAKLGAAVTVVEAEDAVLSELPSALGQVVARRLADLGVTVLTGEMADEPTATGLRLASGAEVQADKIVVAVGRRPNSDNCSLDVAGVTLDQLGYVHVDARRQAARGIYAIGDLTAGPALAHKATAEAEVAVAAITGQAAAFDPTVIPAVVFSDPEVVSVGVLPRDARDGGLHVHRFPHAAAARAQTVGATAGMTIVVADEHNTVVGVHIAGPHASELAGEASLAIEMAATLEDLSLTIHPHPTMSETLPEAAMLALGHPLHIRR